MTGFDRGGLTRILGHRRLPIAAETTQHSHEDRNADDSSAQRKRGQQSKATALDDHARYRGSGRVTQPPHGVDRHRPTAEIVKSGHQPQQIGDDEEIAPNPNHGQYHEVDRICAVAERDRRSDVEADPEHDWPLGPETITDPNREKRTAQCHELDDGHRIAIQLIIYARVPAELRQVGPDAALTGLIDEQCEHRDHGDGAIGRLKNRLPSARG